MELWLELGAIANDAETALFGFAYVRIYVYACTLCNPPRIWNGAEVEAIRKGAGGMFEIPRSALSLCMHPPFQMFVLKDIKTDVFLLFLSLALSLLFHSAPARMCSEYQNARVVCIK